MNINIPDELLEEAGITEATINKLIFEITMLGDRNPVEVIDSNYPNGIIIYVEENWSQIRTDKFSKKLFRRNRCLFRQIRKHYSYFRISYKRIRKLYSKAKNNSQRTKI